MSLDRLFFLQHEVRRLGLDAAILFHSRDIFYYAGTAQPSYLVVRPDDYCLFVRQGMEFAKRETFFPLDRLEQQSKLEKIYRNMLPHGKKSHKIGTELDLLPVSEAMQWQGVFEGVQLTNISTTVLKQRLIKSPDEVELILQACAVAHAGFLAACAMPAHGITELALSAAIENAQRLAGHEGMTFLRRPGVVMGRGTFGAGPNLTQSSGVLFTITGRGLSPAVPVGASRRCMKIGDLVLADISPSIGGYHADQSRMFAIGEPPDGVHCLYRRLRQVADHVMESIRPHHSAGQVFELAWSKAMDLGLGAGFMAFPSGKRAHFVGHGLGLELDEPPLLAKGSSQPLASGMVLALEMHLCAPHGLILKLEDTVLLGDDGCRLLTMSPREVTPLQ